MLIGAIVCVKNEQRIILEWISHYIAIGVQRIHVFDTGSQDATIEKLKFTSLIFPGVTWQPWETRIGWHNAAFAQGIKMMREEGVEWVIACDADEFLCCENQITLQQLLQYFDDSPAIGINWAVYGSNGLVTDPKTPFLESFLRRAPDEFAGHHNIKSIVRPSMVSGVYNSHAFILMHGHYRNTYREKLEWIGTPGIVEEIALTWRFNHYFCRYKDSLNQKISQSKQALDFVVRTEEDWVAHDRNEVYDEIGLYYLEKARPFLVELSRVHIEDVSVVP